MTTSTKGHERLLAAIERRARAQERAGRIRPPAIRARRPGPTREEMAQAMAIADAVLLAQGRNLSPMARGALQAAQTRRAMRQPAGDFSSPAPYQPAASDLALLDQLRLGQLMREHDERPFRGPRGSFEPRTWQSKLTQALVPMFFLDQTAPMVQPLAKGLTARDIRAQLLDFSYVPSPPDRRVWPWKLLSEAEVEDVRTRLYAPGGPVAQRMATTGY